MHTSSSSTKLPAPVPSSPPASSSWLAVESKLLPPAAAKCHMFLGRLTVAVRQFASLYRCTTAAAGRLAPSAPHVPLRPRLLTKSTEFPIHAAQAARLHSAGGFGALAPALIPARRVRHRLKTGAAPFAIAPITGKMIVVAVVTGRSPPASISPATN